MDKKPAKVLDLRYAQVKSGLAQLFDVQYDDAAAFDARLRNLRKQGVPEIPTPGSGTAIAYTRQHMIQLLLALELTALGLAPRFLQNIREMALEAHMQHSRGFGDPEATAVFIVVRPGGEFATERKLQASIERLSEAGIGHLVSASPRVSFVNLSASIGKLDAYLTGLLG